MIFFPNKFSSKWLFWQSRFCGKCSRYLFVYLFSIYLVFTAFLHSSRGDVTSFARKNFRFAGIFTVVSRAINSGGVLPLGVSGSYSLK